MNTSEQHWYPRGYFALLLRVDDRQPNTEGYGAEDWLKRFVAEAREKYDLHIKADGWNVSADARMAECVIAVPFPDRETIRVDYNIFASQADDECGTDLRLHFHMESAL